MSHRLNSLILAVAFLVLVQSTNFAFRILFPATVVYCAVLLFYNYRFLNRQGFYTFWVWIRQLFFIGAIMAVYFGLPQGFSRGIYLLLASALIYIFELSLNVVSEQLNFLQTLLTYLGLSLGIFAGQFYFLPRVGITLAVIAALTYIVSRSSLDYIPTNVAKKNYFSAMLALSCLEIGWALTFLPFHFTALAVIMFNVFYVLWIVIYYHLYNSLSAKKIYFHLIFSGLLIFFVFLSTPWK